jgi:TolB-like protein
MRGAGLNPLGKIERVDTVSGGKHCRLDRVEMQPAAVWQRNRGLGSEMRCDTPCILGWLHRLALTQTREYHWVAVFLPMTRYDLASPLPVDPGAQACNLDAIGWFPSSRAQVSPEPDRLRSVLAERSIALDRELGRGGMSVVYLARDLRHDRLLAVKVLRSGVLGGTERFLREIKLVSPLSHPHIVPLFDSGAVDGSPFFVMPYIEGESLRRRLDREGRLDIAEAVQIAGEIGEALEFAHGREIVHRDIKPENILLQGGHAVVADFGVGRALSEAVDRQAGERLTEQGLVIGTPEYMSPEQASGDRAIDGRSDIFSLGCVLYEMLGGVPPLAGGSAREVLARRFREPVRPLRELRPEVTPELEAVVDKALAPDPADRFAGATEFLAALRSPPARLPDRPGPAPGRTRLRWTALLLGTIALAALARYGARTTELDPRRIVVARLSNETGESTFAYLGGLATDRLTASLAGTPGIRVVTSATIIPSRLTTGLQVDSLDDPERLRALAQETSAGTLISGSYFRSGNRISFQAEITDANHGTLLAAVGPVSAPVNRAGEAVDSLGRGVAAAVHRQRRLGFVPK